MGKVQQEAARLPGYAVSGAAALANLGELSSSQRGTWRSFCCDFKRIIPDAQT